LVFSPKTALRTGWICASTRFFAENYRSTRIMWGQRIRTQIAASRCLFRHIVLRYEDAISPSRESLPTPIGPQIVILSEAGVPGRRRCCVCWGGGVAAHFLGRLVPARPMKSKNPSCGFRVRCHPEELSDEGSAFSFAFSDAPHVVFTCGSRGKPLQKGPLLLLVPVRPPRHLFRQVQQQRALRLIDLAQVASEAP
jgi:hypothetical protein